MLNIKIEKFAKTYVENNKGENLSEVIKRLEEALKCKNKGEKCNL